LNPAVSLRDVGVQFVVPRHSRHGHAPRLFATKKRRVWGLRHATLDVHSSDVLGLIGRNGAGKTTMLRTVAGVYTPDEGSIRIRGRIGPMLSITAGLMPQLSGWENISLIAVLNGLSRREAVQVTPDIAQFSGLDEFLDAEVRTYSSGMAARLGFSVAAFTDPDVLVIDEVLMAGDEEFQQRSSSLIRHRIDEGRTALIASHHMQTLLDLCTRVAWLDHGEVIELGDPAEVVEHYLRAAHNTADS
jgi:ABC-type polysaccharide/polyol phosphate transport system ATPase subunit